MKPLSILALSMSALTVTSVPSTAAVAVSCLALEADSERLACYDEAARASGWELQREPGRNGKENVWLTVYSSQPIPLRLGGKGVAALTLRCLDGTPSAYLSFSDHVFISEQRLGNITYILDELAPKTIPMWESTGNDLLGLWDANRSLQFIRALFGQRNVNVQVTPVGEQPLSADFNISGLETAIAPLRTACGW